jgi:hypothetical protein
VLRIDRDAPHLFLEAGYEPEDWVAVFLKSYDTGETAQRVLPRSAAISPRLQAWLRFRNAAHWNIYVSVNAVAPGRSRTKAAIAAVRHVFLDVDRDGPRFLSELRLRRDLPSPSYVLHTSPRRVHVLWRVCGFDVERVEALQKYLARELGTDSAATACSQMTRLPGFVNYKHQIPHLVAVDYEALNSVSMPRHFPSPRAAHIQNVPAIRTALMLKQVRPEPLDRARRYLARTAPAISGQHGDLRTFRICCRLVRGFALSDDEALSLLRDWNARCEPPWSEGDLLAKLKHARRYGRELVGGLLTDISSRADYAQACK